MKDITGHKFGRLIVLKFSHKEVRGKASRYFWLCKCKCGIEKTIRKSHLISGAIKSCGCLKKTHGMRFTRFYSIWKSMIQRCSNPNQITYKYYGGRGIKVCLAWHKFKRFKDDMLASYLLHCEEYGIKNTTIERINNDWGYILSNCKWAKMKEQANNKRKYKKGTLKPNK